MKPKQIVWILFACMWVIILLSAWVGWQIGMDGSKAIADNYRSLCEKQGNVIIRKSAEIKSLESQVETLTAQRDQAQQDWEQAQFDMVIVTRAPKPVSEWKTVEASWYGPGFYGGKTADGTPFTVNTWCVAHKTLKMGTMLEIEYNGQRVKVPVHDRGPFVAGRELDLSGAVATAIGFSGTHTVRYRILGREGS